MSLLTIIAYTIVFIALSIQFTGSYSKFDLAGEVWTVISILSVVFLVASYIFERITAKKSDRE